MPQPEDPLPTLDVARGDKALAQHLKQSLELLRDRSDNDDFRRLADDVLNGRVSLRDIYHTPAFAAGIDNGVREFGKRWDQLSTDERNLLAAQGETRLREENERLDDGT